MHAAFDVYFHGMIMLSEERDTETVLEKLVKISMGRLAGGSAVGEGWGDVSHAEIIARACMRVLHSTWRRMHYTRYSLGTFKRGLIIFPGTIRGGGRENVSSSLPFACSRTTRRHWASSGPQGLPLLGILIDGRTNSLGTCTSNHTSTRSPAYVSDLLNVTISTRSPAAWYHLVPRTIGHCTCTIKPTAYSTVQYE